MEKKTVYTPRLKKVLKSYQVAATNSLNGPNCFPDSWKAANGHGRDLVPTIKQKPCPPPIIVPSDSGCERSETVLEGEVISCFLVGGEKRLCLPQILNTVLRDFSLQQINNVCDELQIFCSRCTVEQLEVLKLAGILPPSAPSCGLITKTDAERLCADLLYSNPPKEAQQDKKCFSFRVYHECFGKSTGIYFPSLYNSANGKCIMCCECEGLFAPQKFVCHSHKSKENRTCHWGFDSNNWRSYLMLAKDHKQNTEELQEHLNNMKSRFDYSSKHSKKRKILSEKQDEREASSAVCAAEVLDTVKKIKTEDVSGSPPTGSFPSPYPYLFPTMPSWCTDPSMMMYWYPALAAAGATDPSLLAARFSAFKPWIPNVKMKYREPKAPVTSHGSILPQHLATKFAEPPVLQNPEKIVPLSESSRFESHYQPNVALAPSTCKSKDSIDEKTREAVIRKSNNEGANESTAAVNNDNCEDDYFSSTEDTLSENSGLSDEEQGSAKAQKKLLVNLSKILMKNNIEKNVRLQIFAEVERIIKSVRLELNPKSTSETQTKNAATNAEPACDTVASKA